MHELIENYLTDRLSPELKENFLDLLTTDPSFRCEFVRSLAALSMADYSLDDNREVSIPDFIDTQSHKV